MATTLRQSLHKVSVLIYNKKYPNAAPVKMKIWGMYHFRIHFFNQYDFFLYIHMGHSTKLVQIQSWNCCEICMLFGKNFYHIYVAQDLRGTYTVCEQSKSSFLLSSLSYFFLFPLNILGISLGHSLHFVYILSVSLLNFLPFRCYLSLNIK